MSARVNVSHRQLSMQKATWLTPFSVIGFYMSPKKFSIVGIATEPIKEPYEVFGFKRVPPFIVFLIAGHLCDEPWLEVSVATEHTNVPEVRPH